MSSEEDYYYSDEEEYGDSDGGSQTASGTVRRVSSSSRVVDDAHAQNHVEYQCLDMGDLLNAQQKLVDDVASVLSIDKDKANVLLLQFGWNKEKLFDAYIPDPQGTLSKAGALQRQVERARSSKPGELVECPILFDKFPLEETYSMGCTCKEHPEEHRFSILAWQDYLKCKVEDGPDCVFARCPMDACSCVVDPGTWRHILSMPSEKSEEKEQLNAALKKYQKFLLNSFVDINRNMKWCGTAGCTTAIAATGAVTEVICQTCKGTFCFKCGLESHAPISCKALSTWLEKCSNESETANWILANTKKCPKCSVRIEKNQGCNHISCRVCKYNFCWVCMGPWNDHNSQTGGYYTCNKYSPAAEIADDEVSKAKRELDRYLHYYQRYALHDKAGKFATKQRAATIEKMVKLQGRKKVGWIDVQFLDTAVEQLINCRRVLKYTYAFAYYLPDGKEKNLFEDSQSQLEMYTEKLSELTEKPLDELSGSEVTNMTRITGNFMKNLLTQVETEGMVDLATDGAMGTLQNQEGEPGKAVAAGASKKKKTRR